MINIDCLVDDLAVQLTERMKETLDKLEKSSVPQTDQYGFESRKSHQVIDIQPLMNGLTAS